VFEAERQRQYSRELLFSTVVELMTLVSLGLRPSLQAHSGDPERSIRSIMNTASGDHERLLATA
jgi:hypothetical protein